MRRVSAVLGLGMLCFTVACATQEASKMPVTQAFASAAAPPEAGPAETSKPRKPPVNPEKWARSHRRPIECEASARSLISTSGRETAWTYFKACADRSDFGLLEVALDNWAEELKTRAEAPGLLAQIIANRGGAISTDIQLLQKRRVPLFELSAALAQPEAFKGRYLLFVGRIGKIKSVKGRQELVVQEVSRTAEEASVFASGSYGSKSGSSGSASGSYTTSGALGSGSGSASYQSGGSSQYGALETRTNFDFEETGQQIFARMNAADPFLSIDRRFLFLVRFDGARASDDDDSEEEQPRKVALVSLVSYHDVSAGGTINQ